MPLLVEKINENLERLQKQLLNRITSLEKDLREKQAECDKLKAENTAQRQTISDQNTRLQKSAWQSFAKKQDIILGDSVLRDVNEEELINTKLQCHPGAKVSDIISDIAPEVDKSSSYGTVTLVVGINDCLEKAKKPLQAVVDDYTQLIEKAKIIADHIMVSSILPHRSEANDQIELLNTLSTNTMGG